MRVCVVGNCQSVPLSHLLEAANHDIEIIRLPEVHAMKPEEEGKIVSSIKSADLVVAQLIADNYKSPFVSTNYLKDICGEKLMAWPSLYFSGYSPDYIYLRDSQHANFRGPLGEYHNEKLLYAFACGWDAARAVKFFKEDEAVDETWYKNSVESSLNQLRSREVLADIHISDWIEEQFRLNRLFYTFNHPTMGLLIEVAKRVVSRAGINFCKFPDDAFVGDWSLAKIVWPVNPHVRNVEKFSFHDFSVFRGVKLRPSDGVTSYSARFACLYDHASLTEAFFKLYSANEAAILGHPCAKDLLARGA